MPEPFRLEKSTSNRSKIYQGDILLFESRSFNQGRCIFGVNYTFHDTFSDLHLKRKSKGRFNKDYAKIKQEEIAIKYLEKLENVVRERSNDTNGYWIRGTKNREMKEIWTRVYALPSEEEGKTDIFRLDLKGKYMLDFSDENPLKIATVSNDYQRKNINIVDQRLRAQLDEIWHNNYPID